MLKTFTEKPFPFSLLILFLLITAHLVGSYYSLYWRFAWYDFVVHALSGLWAALLILWLSAIFKQINSLKEYKAKAFLISFLAAILIGVIWELVENYSGVISVNKSGYYLDTALDILSDGLGGVLAFWYFVRRKRSVEANQDNLHPFYNQTGLIKA